MWGLFKRLLGKHEVQRSGPTERVHVRCIDSPDGRHRIVILEHRDRFTWEVETFIEVDDGEWGAYEYWGPTECSGLYESAEAAETDARKSVPWLREISETRHNE